MFTRARYTSVVITTDTSRDEQKKKYILLRDNFSYFYPLFLVHELQFIQKIPLVFVLS